MEDYLVIKKNEAMPFAVRQRKKNLIWYCLHVESKEKMVQIKVFTKQNWLKDLREWTYIYQEERMGEGETN